MRSKRIWTLAAALCTALSVAPGAWAQSDAAKIAAARQIGFEGVKDYQAARYTEASDKLERAYALVKAPTLGLWSGRALLKLGKYVAAAERFLETTRLPIPETNQANHKKAQQEAGEERTQLLPKIPSLQVNVTGAPASEVELSMDGVAIDGALIGIARPVDPGTRRVVARWKGQEQTKDVQLAEAAKEIISLEFDPDAAGAAPVPPPAPTETPAPAPAQSSASNASSSSAALDSGTNGSNNTLAYVALGVGGAGLLAGSITGVLALGKKSDLDKNDACFDGACGTEAHDDVDSLNQMRLISTIGFAVGAVGAGAGVVLLLTGDKETKAARRTELFVGPASLRVQGSF